MAFNLFDFFGVFTPKNRLGIDIGTSAIKIVELSQESGRWKLVNYGIYELHSSEGGADAPKSIMDLSDAEIAQAIKDILVRAGMKSRRAVASVSSFSTFATVIEMPYISEEELAKTIPFEARKYIPVPIDQVVLDWSIIGVVDDKDGATAIPKGPVPAGTTVTVEVFLAAVPKDDTARYQRIMKIAGIDLVALELENSSLVRALLGNDLALTAIVNIGGRSSSIVIVSKGYERLGHNYEIGGYEMTKAIASALAVSEEQAEALKRKYGLIDSPENKVRTAMMPLVDMMVFETKKTIESFEQSKGQRISRIVLIGGLANTPGLSQYVKDRISRDVFIGNVFARLIYPQELAPLTQMLSNTISVAVGAAMRET
jgi:type IV pilus assembly protein PilM